MSDARADIIRVLHRAYVDNGWVPPTLDGYADALLAAGYGKLPVPEPFCGDTNGKRVCSLPLGHDGPWHDNGDVCWLINEPSA